MRYPPQNLLTVLRRGGGWLIAGMMLIGTFVLVMAFSTSLRAMHLEDAGVAVVGEVTGLNERTYDCGRRNRSTCHEYKVQYRFPLEDGRTFQSSANIGRDFFVRLKRGDALPLIYVEGNPVENEIEPGSARVTSWVALGVGGGLWIVASLLGARHVKQMRRAIYLRDHGIVSQATVIAKTETVYSVNNRKLHRIVWDNPPGTSWAA
jgi:Protein of unknown function (DUF3592)